MPFIYLHLIGQFIFSSQWLEKVNTSEEQEDLKFKKGNLDLQLISYQFTAVIQNAMFLRKW